MRFQSSDSRLADCSAPGLAVLTAFAMLACAIPVEQIPLPPPVEREGPLVEVARFDDAGQFIETVTVHTVVRNESAWREHLSQLAYRVTREGETEFAYTGEYDDFSAPGIYRCAGCGEALFGSATKYDSETGWPSFWAPLSKQNIDSEFDDSWGVRRLTVRCVRCGAHLGHIFKDGPAPTYLRYCINSSALSFASAASR